MDSSQSSTPASSPDAALLPSGFLNVKQVQDLPSAALRLGQFVNAIGFVKDIQPPRKTSGTHFKCTFEIVDWSVRYESAGIKLHIFWPQNHMPLFGAGDVVLVRNAKAQMFSGNPSLLTNFATEIHVLPSSQIPTSPSDSAKAPWRSYPPKKAVKFPTAFETTYVIGANEHVAVLPLLTAAEFQQKSEQAMNVKDKFVLLKDIKKECYYNILGEIIRVYDTPNGQMAVHFSDYTANSEFYNHVWGDGGGKTARDGDEHGYIKSRAKSISNWPGPFGKMSIQLTLFDEHASFVREQVKARDWVLLKNVRIAYGKMGGCLEGFQHGDSGRVHVEIMERPENMDDIDPRWKAAIARKLEWEKKFAKQQQDILDEDSGKKRKREDESSKPNGKARRKARRAGVERKAAAAEKQLKAKLDLNANIRCENPDQPTVPLADILKPRTIVSPGEPGREYVSPFDIRKYKANVRVVGYFPSKIEDFVVGRRLSEYDMLSDYSGGEDTDPEENMRAFRSGKGAPEKAWEWRFALQVVDASDKSFENPTWLMVSNYEAQMLLNIDAMDLRKDKEALQEVKEKLCILWGDLEEQKSALAHATLSKTQISINPESPALSSYNPGDQPPLDSDDEQENDNPGKNPTTKPSQSATALNERDPNAGIVDGESTPPEQTAPGHSNKAFTCCIKQYGFKVKEDDASLANAGDGKRWKRNFGLFGTMII